MNTALAVPLDYVPEPCRRGPKLMPALPEDELLELIVMLHESPVLQSPTGYASNKRARWRGERLQEQLAEYGVPVKVSAYHDPDQDAWFWLLRLKRG